MSRDEPVGIHQANYRRGECNENRCLWAGTPLGRDGGTDRTVSYNLQKNFDGAAPMGPYIVIGEVEPQNVDVETRINGVVRQSYNTREMIWSFGEVLESFPKTSRSCRAM
jgi:hypothetical protein